MNSGEKITFYTLFDKVNSVEIPILQRDYAQGRKQESDVRTLFLNALHKALIVEDVEQRIALDLDFVYGNIEEKEEKYRIFSVLDGQQRLTTLFLLHWFLALKNNRFNEFKQHFANQDEFCRFTYKTRSSSSEFFDALVSRNFTLTTNTISEDIANNQWFYASWKYDPTVQSCLCMLDAIQTQFSQETDDLYARLINKDTPYITFQYLELNSFGLSDDLYIKMNSRGKPLTEFENFKAKLEQIIKSFDAPWPSYRLSHKENDVSGYEYFSHKIDTQWADLFWPYRNAIAKDAKNSSEAKQLLDNTFDKELMNFVRLIILYQSLLDLKGKPLETIKDAGRNLTSEEVSLVEYEKQGLLNHSFVVRLISILDVMTKNGVNQKQISSLLQDDFHYSETEIFKNVILNKANYSDRLRFYAFYTFLSKSRDLTELQQWMRVVYNLTENNIYNGLNDFSRALVTIDNLIQLNKPILSILTSEQNLSGFPNKAQVREESIKAHLLLKSHDWQTAILQAEKHIYFRGQIGFLLNFSGILAFFIKCGHCSWDEETDKLFFDKFMAYSKDAGKVFELVSQSSKAMNYTWERAVLSKGRYFLKKSYTTYNLLCSNIAKNNISRDYTWHNLLRLPAKLDGPLAAKQNFVKAVFDDPLFDCHKVENSLMAICKQALTDAALQEWKKYFIQYPELFALCMQGFISIDGNEIILLGESQRNHHHYELYSRVLFYRLQKLNNHLPFTGIEYLWVKSRSHFASVQLYGWQYNEIDYVIEIDFRGDHYNIWINTNTDEMHSKELLDLLSSEGFYYTEDEPDWLVNDVTTTLEEVETAVIHLCETFRLLK